MALVRYTLLRTLVLLVTIGVLYLVGLRSFLPLLIVSIFVSGLISLIVLSRTRDEASSTLSGRLGHINERIEASKRAEDDDADPRRDTPPRP